MRNLFFAQNKLHLRSNNIKTITRPRWMENTSHYGVDLFMLEIVAAGQRNIYGVYSIDGVSTDGMIATIWTSTVVPAFPDKNWMLYLSYNNSDTPMYGADLKNGYSIKAVRDASATELVYWDGEVITNVYQDGSGNWYNGVKVGSLIWMVGSLHSLKYQNGTDVPIVEGPYDWSILTTPGLCNVPVSYAHLYNGYTVRTGNLVSGNGWRIATQADFVALMSVYTGTQFSVAQIIKSGRQINHPLG